MATIPMQSGTVGRRRALLLGLAGAAVAAGGVRFQVGAAHADPAATAVWPATVEVWKESTCECCKGWIAHMNTAGFTLTVHDVPDIAAVKQARGVPEDLWSCHTAAVEGYTIEGHVPPQDLTRLLAERPRVKGLAVPGMPASAPGMDMPDQPFDVMAFGGADGTQLYAHH